jgi:non-reducing end alpha-L-arabinofuranosidase
MEMKSAIAFAVQLAIAVTFAPTIVSAGSATARPKGPCDIYDKAGDPCVAAHSTTRALYASYNGPLYQVKRESDGKTLNIGVVKPSRSDAGGYADARAQDAFCATTVCIIQRIYDQSGGGNDLLQAGPGTFKGPAKGGFDTQPIADMAPITINSHDAYGVYIMPGMGFRNNNASGIAINDEPEGIYYVIDGTHYDNGCCFDYGNSSTNGRAVGTGTMETTYFGTSTAWGRGAGPGPWIMSDMEAGLFSGQGAKENLADPTIDSWRFVTAVMDGGGGDRWNLRGGNAQRGFLKTFYSGPRPAAHPDGGYFPMRKQGGILLGTGGDNGNGSAGTFYEGAITRGFPSDATTDAIQANIVAARYDVERLGLSHVTTFTPGSTHDVTETFTNTAGAPITDLRLSIAGPDRHWTAVVLGASEDSKRFAGPIAPEGSVSATFQITSPAATGSGLLRAKAEWRSPTGGIGSDTAMERLRSVHPVKINEVRLGSGPNPTDQFIELYNASSSTVDLSGWTLVSTRSQWAPVTLVTIPKGTSIGSDRFYLLKSSSSGLAAPVSAGARTIYVRNAVGFAAGQKIEVEDEVRTIESVGTEATPMTKVFVPVSTGPWLNIPAGATNLPVTSADGFEAGQKIGIDAGGNYEMASVTKVGKAATQTALAAALSAGATNIKLAGDANVSAGDALTIGTGPRKENVKVSSVGTSGASGTGVELANPVRLDHASGVDVSDVGTGISFSPPTRFPHWSGDAVQALGSGVTLDRPLARSHAYGAAVAGQTGTVATSEEAPVPNQWFGYLLSPTAGSIALMDARGTVVDAVVYGSQQSNSSGNGTIASPELAILEGDQSAGGCIAVVRRQAADMAFSLGRYPDGADTDSNCFDFHGQSVTNLALASPPGAINIKVASVEGFFAGQKILIDSGENLESATIANVGTPGATIVESATAVGATIIPVANAYSFRPGQAILVGEGADQEPALITVGDRRNASALTIESPLKFPHGMGTQVAGTGITFTSALSRAHGRGTQIADHFPTPGAPNKYGR